VKCVVHQGFCVVFNCIKQSGILSLLSVIKKLCCIYMSSSYGLGFFWFFVSFFLNLSKFGYLRVILHLCMFMCFWEFVCQYQWNWLPRKTRVHSDLCVEWNVSAHSLPTLKCFIHKVKLGNFVLILSCWRGFSRIPHQLVNVKQQPIVMKKRKLHLLLFYLHI